MDFTTSTHRHRWILSTDDLVRDSVAAAPALPFSRECHSPTARALRGDGVRRSMAMQQNHRADQTHPHRQSAARHASNDPQVNRMQQANGAGNAHVLQLRATHGLPTENVQGLTSAEEQSIVRFYTSMLASLSQRKSMPVKVVATAVTFLKRFYLDHSNMEYDALRIAPTCLYIACKTCEHYQSAESVSELVKLKGGAKDILQLETAVLQGLKFDLVVYEPYRCIDAMMQELRTAAAGGEALLLELRPQPSEALGTAHKLAYSMTHSMIQSEAPLTMCPQRQALCAVCHALVKGGLSEKAVLARYARKSRAPAWKDSGSDDVMLAALKDILAWGNELAADGHQKVDKEVVKALDSKMRAHNPLMDKHSELYKRLKRSKRRRIDADGVQEG